MTWKLTCLMSLALLSGCSSIQTIENPHAEDLASGLLYYLPEKDVRVTIDLTNDEKPTVSIDTTAAYPDYTRPYVLRYDSNWIGQNVLAISVNEKGLLTSASSTTTSGASQALQNLAASAGHAQVGFRGVVPTGDKPVCASGQKHTFVFAVDESGDDVCGLKIGIRAYGLPPGDTRTADAKLDGKRHSGVFYRQETPYIVTVTGKLNSANAKTNVSRLIFSPSESPVYFLPIKRTVFADNDAGLEFTNGMPTQYRQEADGEAVALLKLPADVIGAYFGAVGEVFSSFGAARENEAAAVNSSLALEVARERYEACITAIRSGDDELVEALGC